jgi:hypothetical protein
MSWKITITVTDSRFATACAAIVAYGKITAVERDRGVNASTALEPVDMDQVWGVDPVIGLDKRGRNHPTTFISLGPKEAHPGSVPSRIIAVLEKLEKAHGPHNVTRAQLNEAMRKAKLSDSDISTGVTNSIKAGYLKSRPTN